MAKKHAVLDEAMDKEAQQVIMKEEKHRLGVFRKAFLANNSDLRAMVLSL